MHSLLHRLVDDAALFPPGNAPMPAAVTGHRTARAGSYAWLVGRFLCPASRLTGLRNELRAGDEIELGLIADTGTDGLPAALASIRAEPRVRLSMIEIAVSRETMQRSVADTIAALPEGVPAHLELPRAEGWRDALNEIARQRSGQDRLGAKLRTGGLRADLFPAPEEVAAFVSACAEQGVPFKCTAGLHHAVRHTDPATGFTHHGFLNILLATCRAVTGADVVEVLSCEDGKVLADEARAVSAQTAGAARALFVAYGSCSLSEPYQDLLSLGVTRGTEEP